MWFARFWVHCPCLTFYSLHYCSTVIFIGYLPFHLLLCFILSVIFGFPDKVIMLNGIIYSSIIISHFAFLPISNSPRSVKLESLTTTLAIVSGLIFLLSILMSGPIVVPSQPASLWGKDRHQFRKALCTPVKDPVLGIWRLHSHLFCNLTFSWSVLCSWLPFFSVDGPGLFCPFQSSTHFQWTSFHAWIATSVAHIQSSVMLSYSNLFISSVSVLPDVSQT